MKAERILLSFLTLGLINVILADIEALTNGTSQSETEKDLVANDTSTAEQILDFLIDNNSAVNFALKRGNNKRKQQQTQKDEIRDVDNDSLTIDNQINNRISSYLNKKNSKLTNVTALVMKVDETLDLMNTERKENPLRVNVDKVTPSLPPFFSNAYNRVVHLLNNSSKENIISSEVLPKPPKKPTEEEILTEFRIENNQKVDGSKPLVLEDTINKIGSQLIEKISTNKSDNNKFSITLPSLIAMDNNTKQVSTVDLSVTTEKPFVTTNSITQEVSSTTHRTSIQKLSDRVGGLLERLGINKAKTEKPLILNNNRYTSQLNKLTTQIPFNYTTSQSLKTSTIASGIPAGNAVIKETAESINNVQSFLQQFGVTLNNFSDTTTQRVLGDLNDFESMRLPTTFRTTRKPYPWTTNRYRPSNDGQTSLPNYFEEMETTTKRFFPTSFWRKTTSTAKPSIRYPTRMSSNNKITSELSDANLIDTDNQNTTLIKISVLNAGCQAEKSVLMLFNKNQKVLISIDTTDETDNKSAEKPGNQSVLNTTKRPNGVELQIDEEIFDSEIDKKPDDIRLEENKNDPSDESNKASTTAKPSNENSRSTTTKRIRSTRLTTPKVRTTRTRITRQPQQNENITIAPTKKKQKRRRTKGNKRKGNRNKNRTGPNSAIPIANSTIISNTLPSNNNFTR